MEFERPSERIKYKTGIRNTFGHNDIKFEYPSGQYNIKWNLEFKIPS